MQPPRFRTGLHARLCARLGTGLTDLLTLVCLAVTGAVLRLTVNTMPLGFFGEHEATIETASFFGPWLLMGGYGIARGLHETWVRWVAPRLLPKEETPSSSLARRRVAAAKRQLDGLHEHVLTREELLGELERVLRPSRRGLSPTALLLVRVTSPEGEAMLQAEVANALLGSARTDDFVGHLGDGLFGLVLPRTAAGKGQRLRQELCSTLCEVADGAGASVHESFVTTNGHEELRTLYERATSGLSAVELSLSGALRRAG